MFELDLDALNPGVQALADQGLSVAEIVDLLQLGMQMVGGRFARGEYYLADLIVSGMMFKSALSLVTTEAPPLNQENCRGRVLIGVMSDDIHDMGKDIIAQVLRVERFDVLDLGIDVPSEAFVQAALKCPPDVIALSGVMSESACRMHNVVVALTEAGIFPQTPILVGGACVDELILDSIGPVVYARGPMEALEFCKKIVG